MHRYLLTCSHILTRYISSPGVLSSVSSLEKKTILTCILVINSLVLNHLQLNPSTKQKKGAGYGHHIFT